MLSHGGHGGWTDPPIGRLSRSFRAWPCGGGFLGFRFASPQAILKRSFAAEGAGTNALEKRKRDGSSSKVHPRLSWSAASLLKAPGRMVWKSERGGQVKFEGPRSIPAASTAAEVAASMDAEARLG